MGDTTLKEGFGASPGTTPQVVSGASLPAHTPGPWFVSSHPLVSHIFEERADGFRLADVHQYGPKSLTKRTREANARLIAAAPDLATDGAFLLARLDEFESNSDDEGAMREFYGHVAPAMARFRTALAKALGPSAHDTSDGQVSPGRDQ